MSGDGAARAAPPAGGSRSWPRAARLALRALEVLVVLGLFSAAITARVVYAGETEIAASTAALRAGDPVEAVVRARRAAGWYAPGAPHVRVAYERLVALAAAAEGLGDRDTALLAWRGVRSASLETRWLATPHAQDLARADRAIARLAAAGPRPPAARTDPAAKIERAQLEALARDEAPRAPWIAVLACGMAAWVAGAAWTVRRAVSATGHLAPGRALPGILTTAAGLAAYLFAIWRA